MKKAISLILSVVMIISIVAGVDLSAYAVMSESYTYTVENGEATISLSSYSSPTPSGKITIPSEIDGYPVTRIGDFYNCTEITNIVIPNSVKSISNNAFQDCTGLVSVTIPSSVEEIEHRAFMNCFNLQNVTIENGVKVISAWVFYNCSSLKNITLPESLEVIYGTSFYSCNNLTTITVDTDNPNFFSQDGVLFNKSKDKLIIYPQGKNEETYSIPSGVENVGSSAFRNCSNLKAISIPNSIIDIGAYSFTNCSNISEITIPNSVITIGESAFEECSSITKIKIPVSVASIGEGAFSDCSALVDFTVDSNNEYYRSYAGILYNKDRTELIQCGSSYSLQTVTIPTGVARIDKNAFASCKNIVNITIPESVSSIGTNAFYHCYNIEKVNIKDLEKWCNIKFGEEPYVATSANPLYAGEESKLYLNDVLITDLVIPNSITSLGDSVFAGINVNSITIPNSVVNIDFYSFYGCSDLSNLTIPCSLNVDDCFKNINIDTVTLTNHSYLKEVIAPTCISQGYTINTCECGDTFYDNYTDEVAHTEIVNFAVPATCTETGLTEGSSCSICGAVIKEQETTLAIGHKSVTDEAVSATCTKNGLTEGSHCSVCNEVLVKQESIPIIPHQYKSSVVQATADSRGYTAYTCSTCGDTYNADYFDSATVYSDFSDATAGSTIRVPVSIKNNTGILGWKLTFDYDKDVLTPISVEYGDVISGGIQDNIEGDMVPGSINVYWAGSGNENYNGVMIYINFAVNQSAVGNTKIDISFSQEDTFDDNFNDVYLDCQPINLNIANNNYSQYAKINASANDVIAGNDVQLKLNISEINSVTNTNITVDYNADNFEFKSVNADGVTVKDTNSNGKVTLNVSGITSSIDNTDFVTLTFKAKDKAMSGNYDFAVSSTDEGIICKGCTVKITPSATSEIAEIYADDVTANYDETITIPIYIENNHGIMGYRLDLKYDVNVLQPVSATCGSDFVNNGQFNDSIGVKDGEFKVLWNNVDEKYNNGTLLTLKFKVLTQEKVDTVISMTYSQPDTFNEKYEDVVFNCRDINVSLNNHQHSYVAVVTEPTCTERGYTTYTCSCGDSYIADEKAALGHNYISNVVAPTCTQQGYTEHTCSRCNDTYNDNYTSVSSHSYDNGVITTQPTCESDGVKTYTCTVCGNSYIEKVVNLNHNYKAVVTEPTCTEKGYTTHTCSRCGNSYVDNEVSALGHSYGQWTYNGDAVYNSSSDYKNGTQTRTCTVCGSEETVEAPNTALLRRRGVSLTLESSIIMNVMVGKNEVDYFDDVYVEVTRSTTEGELVEKISDFDIYNSSFYKFIYHGVTPQGLNDDLKFVVYGIKDGVKYWGPEYHYSVATYIQQLFSSTKSTNLKTLLADLVYYGYQYQLYTNYNTDNPLTNILTEEQLAYRTKKTLELNNISTSSYETIDNPTVVTGASLRIDSKVSIVLVLANQKQTNPVDFTKVKVKVIKDNGTPIYYSYKDNPEMFEKSGNYFNFYYDGVEAKESGKPIYFTVVDENNKPISNTRRYSIESYCYLQKGSSNQKLRNLCDSLIRYCKSAEKYFANPNV